MSHMIVHGVAKAIADQKVQSLDWHAHIITARAAIAEICNQLRMQSSLTDAEYHTISILDEILSG